MALSALACSLGDDSDGAGASGATGGVRVVLGNNAGQSSSGGASSMVGSSTMPGDCDPQPDENACVGESFEGEAIPLDIYIMFDQSGSMCSCIEPAGGQLCPDPNCRQTRMGAVRDAADRFLRDPQSAGINVGIGYFGKQPIGEASCAASEYADAAVGMGELPGHAQAIMDSLSAVKPTGETPTSAAIRGACSYAQAWKRSVPSHQVVILLLTDGKPEAPITCGNPDAACCPTLDDAVAAASDCLKATPSIRTYVLGVGPLLANLAQIAAAGGTDHAYLVESGDVSQEVLNALNRIRRDAAIPCDFQLPTPPDNQVLRYDQVNLRYSDSQCNETTFYYVESAERCGARGGWYYDEPQNPHKISLCPSSCELVSAPGGRLSYSLGCETLVLR